MARKGLVRTFQIARELSEMTVLENLMLAPKGQIGESAIRSVTPGLRGEVVAQEEEIRERAWETLDFFEIDHLATEHAGNLSGGQRKLLEMARALTDRPGGGSPRRRAARGRQSHVRGEAPRSDPPAARGRLHVPPRRTRYGRYHEQLRTRHRHAPGQRSRRRDRRRDTEQRTGHRGVPGEDI